MARKKKRGRPLTYKRRQRRKLAEMIRLHGARGTRKLAGKPISVGTLVRIAREFDIELKKGRRPRPAATRFDGTSTRRQIASQSKTPRTRLLPAARAVRALNSQN